MKINFVQRINRQQAGPLSLSECKVTATWGQSKTICPFFYYYRYVWEPSIPLYGVPFIITKYQKGSFPTFSTTEKTSVNQFFFDIFFRTFFIIR